MTKKIWIIVAAGWLLACQPVLAQRFGWEAGAYGFFDNSEGDDKYRLADTFSGIRLEPRLSVSSDDGRHKLVGGYDFLLESGVKPKLGTQHIVGYYQYEDKKCFRFLMGSYPRRLQREQMRDYMLCDSLRYFRPNMTGFDMLYETENGYVEAFLDWTFKRDSAVREQFMVGVLARRNVGRFHIGVQGYYYHYAKMLRGVKENEHGIHENLLVHPYVGMTRQRVAFIDSLDVRAGVLLNIDRDRFTDKKFHFMPGFLAEADATVKRFSLSQLVYLGRRQQYYGEGGFGKYYWGDTYYRSPWYSRTDVRYTFFSDRYATLRAGLVFHLADGVFRWNQQLTLSVRIGEL